MLPYGRNGAGLQQDAGATSRVALQANAATMLQVYEYRKRIVHHLMGTHAFDVGERSQCRMHRVRTSCDTCWAVALLLETSAFEPVGRIAARFVLRR